MPISKVWKIDSQLPGTELDIAFNKIDQINITVKIITKKKFKGNTKLKEMHNLDQP